MTTWDEPVYVVSLGASTPVGRDAVSSAAAVRAGVSGFTTHPYMIDTAGEPMRAAIAPWLDLDCQGQERLEALLFPAMEQALQPLDAARDADVRVAPAIGLPSARPGLPSDLGASLRTRVAARYPRRFVAQAVLENGHAAAILGLHASMRKMADGDFDACLVAGVESYLAPETLEWLEGNDQLHGAGPLNNAWGFVPGEGAGAALIVAARALTQLQLEPLGRVLSVGRGFEPNRIKTQTVCVGEGLTVAFREALAALPPGGKVTDVYCDMNGEPYRADEFGFAAIRTKEGFASASDFVAPADCWGDVSAASAPLGLVLSVLASKKSYASGPLAFVWASSESGERGAMLLALPVHEAN
jgi:3-oxoacyl-[acyl-carrier-protein] synthase-1